MRKVVSYICRSFFNTWLKEDSWILKSVSAFNVLKYHLSCSLWKTSLYTHERMIEKGVSLWKDRDRGKGENR